MPAVGRAIDDGGGRVKHLSGLCPPDGIEAALGGNERLLVHADRCYIGTDFIVPRRSYNRYPLTLDQMVENREIGVIRRAVERGIAHLKVLDILKSGIRTRSPQRDEVIDEIIAVTVGLYFFKQKMRAVRS